MKTMTKRQKEIIDDNLKAYIANFGYIVIENRNIIGKIVIWKEWNL